MPPPYPPVAPGDPASADGYGASDGPAVPSEPRTPRSEWLPLLVVSLVTVLVAGALFATDRDLAGQERTAASAYLPSDGAVSHRARSTTKGNKSVTSTFVEESARRSGGLVVTGLDYTLGTKVGGVVGFDHLDRAQLWRTTDTEIGGVGSPQQVRVYRVDQAVTLIADSTVTSADIYSPGLVELPADVAAGSSWSSEGTVGTRRYRSEFRAEAAEPGCLTVSGTIQEWPTAGQPGSTRAVSRRQVSKLWCQSRGIVSAEVVHGTTTVTDAIVPGEVDAPVQTTTETWDWTDPATWRRKDFDLRSDDPTLGPGAMTGTPALVPAVVTASGLLVRATNGDDLVATTPRTVDAWTTLWRMHPGGTVLSVAGFGNMVVATTSLRQAVGYSDTGVRLWSVQLDDVAFHPPVRVDDRRIAIGDAAGGVRVVDALTGAEIWQAQVSDQLSAPLLADDQVVVAIDAGGTTTAFAADSGHQLWTSEVSGTLGAIFADLVVVRQEGTIVALDRTTGRHRWLLAQPGTQDALQPFGGRLLAASKLGTFVIDERGVVQQRLPAYAAVSVVADTMIGWGVTAAEVRGPDLSLRATLDTPDRTLTSVAYSGVPYRHGLIVLDRNWTFTTWSSEP